MSRLLTLRPNGDTSRPAAWAIVGGQPSMNQALADSGVDSTYVRNQTTFEPALVQLDDPTGSPWTANDIRVTNVVLRGRGYRSGALSSLRLTTFYGTTADTAHQDDFLMDFGSGAVKNFTGRSRTRDPAGNRWTKASIQYLGVLFWVNNQLDISVTSMSVDVYYFLPPVTVVTGPAGGTVLTSTPAITWTSTQEDGVQQNSYKVRLYTLATTQRGDFDPENTKNPIAYSGETVSSDTSWIVAQPLLNGETYRAYVKTATNIQGTPHWSPWAASSAFTVSFEAPAVPSLLAEPMPDAGLVRLAVQGLDNLLTTQDASLERITTDTGAWAQFGGTVTLANSATVAYQGTRSMRMTSGAAATMSVLTPLGGIYVQAGEQISASAQFRASSTGRQVRISLLSWSAAGITGGADGTTVTDASGSWVQAVVNGFTVPAGSIYVTVHVSVISPASGEIHYVDAIKVNRGATATAFSRGGLVTRNLLLADDSDFEAGLGTWLGWTNTTAVQSATFAATGTKSMRLTAGSAGTGMLAFTAVGTGGVPVIPGEIYTVMASLRAAATPRPVSLSILWHDSGGVALETSTVDFIDVTGSFTQLFQAVVAPADASYAAVQVSVNGALATGEVHYVDSVSLARDTSTLWTRGQDSLVTPWLTVQASDDNGVTWRTLDGAARATPDVYEAATIYDPSCPPRVERLYRARVEATDPGATPPPSTVASDWSAPQSVSCPTVRWWLKHPTDPDLSIGFDHLTLAAQGGVSRAITERSGRFQGIGSRYPIFVTESVGGQDGSLVVKVYGDERWQQVLALLESGLDLWLVDPIAFEQYLIHVTGRDWSEGVTGEGPVRELHLSYEQVG